MIVRLDEITPEKILEIEAHQADLALSDLLRASVVKAGDEYRAALVHANRVELDCMSRARRLYELGFDKKEIQGLFDVDRKTLNRWMKGMN